MNLCLCWSLYFHKLYQTYKDYFVYNLSTSQNLIFENVTFWQFSCMIQVIWFVKVKYLIPWPGPQATFSIQRPLVPGPMDTQSSPVDIFELRMETMEDDWTWMPSVFGLFPSAETLTPCIFTLRQPLITTWNIWLLSDVSPEITTLLELWNPMLCL